MSSGQEIATMRDVRKNIAPYAIVLLGVVWRLLFLAHDSLWPDEGLYLYLAEKLSHAPLNLTGPDGRFFFFNPPLYMYILSLVSRVADENTIILGRLLTVLFDAGTIYVVYRIALHLYDRKVALLSSALLACNPLHVWMSTRILVDVPLTFFVYLALLLLLLDRRGWFFGAATAASLTKYPALPLFIMPLTERIGRKPRFWLIVFSLGVTAIALFASYKPEWPDAPPWIAHFWNFIGMPKGGEIFRESCFFLDPTIVGLALAGLVFAVKRGTMNILVAWLLLFGAIRLFLPWMVFRLSRYSLPLYPGIIIMASAGASYLYAWIKASRPHLQAVTSVVLVSIIAYVLVIYGFRGYEVTTLNAKTFTGFRDAAKVLMSAGSDQALLTASQGQFAYCLPQLRVVDLPRETSPEGLIALMREKRISYLAIDRWSPHQPRWCGDYPFAERGFEVLYASKNFLIFRRGPGMR